MSRDCPKHILRRDNRVRFRLYFIEAPSVGQIKIGITGEMDRRLRSLRASSPVDLSLMLDIAGTARQEAALHRAFAADRTHGEWFKASDGLRRFIEEMSSMDERARQKRLGRMRTAPLARQTHDVCLQARRSRNLWRSVARLFAERVAA